MEQYIIEHWEGIGVIAYTIMTLARAWWSRRTEAERLKVEKKQTENKTVEILMASLQSALSSVQSLQGQIDGLQSHRLKQNEERIAQQNEIDRLNDAVTKTRADAELATIQLSGELVKVRGKLAEAEKQIDRLSQEAQVMKDTIADLTRALTAAQLRVRDLELREKELTSELKAANEKIAKLERDNRTKDDELTLLKGRVKDLETALDKAQKERAQLECEKEELLQRLATIDAEPGETKPEEPEKTDEPQGETSNGTA